MAKVILEVTQRGVTQYHKIDKLPAFVGRAYDNDIILQDMSVSPHHMQIVETEEGIQINNLSDENGTALNKTKLKLEMTPAPLPSLLNIGSVKARLLSPDMPVEKTRINECTGYFCLLSSPIWSFILLGLTTLTFFLEAFLNQSIEREPIFYFNQALAPMLTILGITIVITGLSRLSTHRWEIIPAISIASLIFLVPQILEYIGSMLNYFFVSKLPMTITRNLSGFILIPFLLALFMVRTSQVKWITAIGVAALVSSPIIAYKFSDIVDKLSLKSIARSAPSYSQDLSPYDIRVKETKSLDDYFENAGKQLEKNMKALNDKAKESNS